MGIVLSSAAGLAEAAKRIAAANNLTDSAGGDGPNLWFCDRPTIVDMDAAMGGGACCIVETQCQDDILGQVLLDHLWAGGIGLSLRTDTANNSELSNFFARMICARFALADGMCETLDLALCEGLSNAITHGNLGIAGLSGADIDHFASYCEVRTQRLTDEACAGRRVDLSALMMDDGLEVSILDRGQGYIPAQPYEPPPLIGGGLGLEILKTLASDVGISEGGRCLTIHFSR